MVRGGYLIKAARKSRGLTQEEVAQAYGVSLKTIQRWESYQTEPKFCDVMSIVSDICKTTLAYLEGQLIENN